MRINSINNSNQSFTAFRVSKQGAKELARKCAENPEFEDKLVENTIKPLAYTMTNVIYEQNNSVIINPAHDIMTYYSIPDRGLYIGSDYTHVLLKNLDTGEMSAIQVETSDVKDDFLDMSELENKLEIAKRVAKQLDINNRYYRACHSLNDPDATVRYNEDKLQRLYIID